MLVILYAPVVEGKAGPVTSPAMPLTTICPAALTATACAVLAAEPPRRSENMSSPLESSLATKDRWLEEPVGAVPRLPPRVTGKSGDVVEPATYAFPAASTSIALAESLTDPPR